jgi:hypothetical protein
MVDAILFPQKLINTIPVLHTATNLKTRSQSKYNDLILDLDKATRSPQHHSKEVGKRNIQYVVYKTWDTIANSRIYYGLWCSTSSFELHKEQQQISVLKTLGVNNRLLCKLFPCIYHFGNGNTDIQQQAPIPYRPNFI